ncbi:MAG: histidine phosphatase family protein [Myxococcota bacterium]
MELLLIRHGLPLRAESRDGSPVDPELSAEGRNQARRLAESLRGEPIEALYASPMRRARETAQALAEVLSLEIQVDADLVELDHLSGVYVPLEELKASDYPRWQALVQQGGLYADVDLPAFRRQVTRAIERIIAAHSGGRVAVACHGGVINAWTSGLLGVEELFVFEPVYTGVSRFLAARSGERSLLSLNESGHLRD